MNPGPAIIDTVTPMWAWIIGLAVFVALVCWAEWKQRRADTDEQVIEDLRSKLPRDPEPVGGRRVESQRDQLRPWVRES